MPSDYTPIDCNVYDELTLLVLRRRPVEIVHRTPGGAVIRTVDVVEDVFTRGPEEFARLAEGGEVRLDRLVAVDGRPLPDAC